MTAYPVPSSDPINNPTILAPYDETQALRKRVSVLERPTGGYVTVAAFTAGLATKAPVNLTATADLDFPSVAANGGTQGLNVAVVGAVVGDTVALGAPASVAAGLVWNAHVTAADTVQVRLTNTTAAPIDPASATWKVTVIP